METMPEPTADRELPPAVTKEPVRITALTIALELKPSSESDQVCELATSVPLGVLVELDNEDWLIYWDTEVLLPTLPSFAKVCRSPSSPPAADSITPPRPADLSAPPWLLPPLAPPRSLISLA